MTPGLERDLHYSAALSTPKHKAQSNATDASLCAFTLYPLPFSLCSSAFTLAYFRPYTGP